MNNKFDVIANKIMTYLKKNNVHLNDDAYDDAQHYFIDKTMSCDAGEVIMYAKMFLEDLINAGTNEVDRINRYSEYLAVYDLYKSVKNQL